MLFDVVGTTNENVYKLLVATIGPRPIAWVTTQDVDGTLNAAPFSFFNAMSGNPPVVAFGIGGRAPGDVKDTGGNIRRTGRVRRQPGQLQAGRANEHHRDRFSEVGE